jgi:hypothetical protein
VLRVYGFAFVGTFFTTIFSIADKIAAKQHVEYSFVKAWWLAQSRQLSRLEFERPSHSFPSLLTTMTLESRRLDVTPLSRRYRSLSPA